MSKRPSEGAGGGAHRAKSSRSTSSHLSEVPSDVMANILSYLSREDVKRLAMTSKSMRRGVKEQRELAEKMFFVDECRRLTENYAKCGLQRVEHCEEECKTNAGNTTWLSHMDFSWISDVRYANIRIKNAAGEVLDNDNPVRVGDFDVSVDFDDVSFFFTKSQRDVFVKTGGGGNENKVSQKDALQRIAALIHSGQRPKRVWSSMSAPRKGRLFAVDDSQILDFFQFLKTPEGVFDITIKLFDRNPQGEGVKHRIMSGVGGWGLNLDINVSEIEMLMFGPPIDIEERIMPSDYFEL
jgi:hypothetical protein